MDDVVLLDFEKLSLQNVAKIKRLLTNAVSAGTRRRRPADSAKGEQSIESIARSVLSSAIKAFEVLDSGNMSTPKSLDHAYEVSKLAIASLYRAPLPDANYTVEKLHATLAVKLLDAKLTTESLRETSALFERLVPLDGKFLHEQVLSCDISAQSQDYTLLNLVVSCQILLLKVALRHVQQGKSPPVSFQSLLRSCLSRQVFICSRSLPEKYRNHKTALLAKLLLSLSNYAPSLASLQLRLIALQHLPSFDDQYLRAIAKGIEDANVSRCASSSASSLAKEIGEFCRIHTDVIRNSKLALAIQNLALGLDAGAAANDLLSLLSESSGSLITNVSVPPVECTPGALAMGSPQLNVDAHFTTGDFHKVRSFMEATEFQDCASADRVMRHLARWIEGKPKDDLDVNDILSLFQPLLTYFTRGSHMDSIQFVAKSLFNAGNNYSRAHDFRAAVTLYQKSVDVQSATFEAGTINMRCAQVETLTSTYLSLGDVGRAVASTGGLLESLIEHHDLLREPDAVADIWQRLAVDRIRTTSNRLARVLLKFDEIDCWVPERQDAVLELVLWSLRNVHATNSEKLKLASHLLEGLFLRGGGPLAIARASCFYFFATGETCRELSEWCSDAGNGSCQSADVITELYVEFVKVYILQTVPSDVESLWARCSRTVGAAESLLLHVESGWLADLLHHEVDHLSAYFEIQGLHVLRVRLLKSYLERLDPGNLTERKMRLALGWSCHLLGYTKSVDSIVSSMIKHPSGDVVEAMCHSLAIEHYVGEHDARRATKSFEDLCTLIASVDSLNVPISLGRSSGESAQHFYDRLLLFTKATAAQARLHMLKGRIVKAIRTSSKLSKLLSSLCTLPGLYGQSFTSSLLDFHFDMAVMCERAGIVRSTLHHISEGQKLSDRLGCHFRQLAFMSLRSEVMLRIGDLTGARQALVSCDDLSQGLQVKDLNYFSVIHSTMLFLQTENRFSEEKVYFDLGNTIFRQLREQNSQGLQEDLLRRLACLSLNDQVGIGESSVPLDLARNKLLRCFVRSLQRQGRLESAHTLLTDAVPNPVEYDTLMHEVEVARGAYLRARRALLGDPVLGTLEDSALSLPSTFSNEDRLTSSTAFQSSKSVLHLVRAKEVLCDCAANMHRLCSNVEVAEISQLFNSVTMLLSAISAHGSSSKSLACFETAKAASILSERAISLGNPGLDLLWPRATACFSRMNEAGDTSTTDGVSGVPSNWLVVSLSTSESGDLIISRYESDRQPFTVNLPLNRHNSRDADESSFSFEDGIAHFQRIMSDNRLSIGAAKTPEAKTPEGMREWWGKRFDLDKELQQLLHDVEYCWIGGFKGILDTTILEKSLVEKFVVDFAEVLNRYLPSRTATRTRTRSRLTKSSAQMVNIDPRIFELFLGLGHPDTFTVPELLEDLVYFVLDILQFHGEQNAYDELDIDQIVVEVEEHLRSYHCRAAEVSGNRTYEHIVLVLDKHCQTFPWESIPTLRNKSVSRVPSLKILQNLVRNNPIETEVNRAYYVLNPGKDLVRTQKRVEGHLTSMDGWHGVIGNPPSEEEIAKELRENDLFIYIGHGGGEAYIRSSKIKSLENCCPSFLLGCSSGVLHQNGQYDPWGTALYHLAAGSPMVVANLWDVTDKDIDMFSISMLRRWGCFDSESKMSIGQAVLESRDDCKLPYLNGASPVIYGLPLALKSP